MSTKEETNGSFVESTIDPVPPTSEVAEGCKSPAFGYGFKEDKSLWVRFTIPKIGEIRFNPVVTGVALLLIWLFVGICGKVEDLPFAACRTWIVDKFTWLYIGSINVWAIFAIVLYFSKYSSIKLGKDTDVPEFGDATWFMMLFACGIGIGLFFFSVAEPVYHYTQRNRYSADPTLPDNTLAQIAINLTLYHWGIHGWIVYSLVGLVLGLLSYREGLPMTMKSCFYPLIGDGIFGWMGDVIDIVSIVTTLFGVCTSLGLGTRQLNMGLAVLNPDIPGDDVTVQVIIIWCITVVATISTVSGVGMGIRRLSEVCFCVGMFLMLVVLFMENTFFILNLYVQSIGFYLQNIIQLGFHTDSWEQLGPSHGWPDRKRWLPEKTENSDGPAGWMDSWTMFYWGWWISWCPFVGMFIAKISKGRTIRQYLTGTIVTPVLYTFMWMVIFGGAGIRQERSAAALGLCCGGEKGGEGWFLSPTEINSTHANLMDTIVDVGISSSSALCRDGICGKCAKSVVASKHAANVTYGDFLAEYLELGSDFGSVTADRAHVRLSCHVTEQMWFDVMRSYGDIGGFLAGFSLLSLVLYFVTSSDSGSLVIDCLAANGDAEPPRIQRVFWALMEGATATALLVAGGKDGLVALQTAGLLAGLPYTFLTSLLCVSIWRTVQVASGDVDPQEKTFDITIFAAFSPNPYREWRTSARRNGRLFVACLKNIVLAPITIVNAHKRVTDPTGPPWIAGLFSVSTFLLFVLFHLLQLVFNGSWAIAWFWYLCFVTVMTAIRTEVRHKLQIRGNSFEDFFVSLFLYPCCALQMDETTRDFVQGELRDKEGRDNASIEDIGLQNVGYSSHDTTL